MSAGRGNGPTETHTVGRPECRRAHIQRDFPRAIHDSVFETLRQRRERETSVTIGPVLSGS